MGASLIMGGCSDNENKNTVSAPAANISGRWTGSSTDSSDTGTTSVEFLFIQSGSKINGTSSFLGTIEGSLYGRTLTIDGTDLVGYLADDNETIRGTYTTTSGSPTTFSITKDD